MLSVAHASRRTPFGAVSNTPTRETKPGLPPRSCIKKKPREKKHRVGFGVDAKENDGPVAQVDVNTMSKQWLSNSERGDRGPCQTPARKTNKYANTPSLKYMKGGVQKKKELFSQPRAALSPLSLNTASRSKPSQLPTEDKEDQEDGLVWVSPQGTPQDSPHQPNINVWVFGSARTPGSLGPPRRIRRRSASSSFSSMALGSFTCSPEETDRDAPLPPDPSPSDTPFKSPPGQLKWDDEIHVDGTAQVWMGHTPHKMKPASRMDAAVEEETTKLEQEMARDLVQKATGDVFPNLPSQLADVILSIEEYKMCGKAVPTDPRRKAEQIGLVQAKMAAIQHRIAALQGKLNALLSGAKRSALAGHNECVTLVFQIGSLNRDYDVLEFRMQLLNGLADPTDSLDSVASRAQQRAADLAKFLMDQHGASPIRSVSRAGSSSHLSMASPAVSTTTDEDPLPPLVDAEAAAAVQAAEMEDACEEARSLIRAAMGAEAAESADQDERDFVERLEQKGTELERAEAKTAVMEKQCEEAQALITAAMGTEGAVVAEVPVSNFHSRYAQHYYNELLITRMNLDKANERYANLLKKVTRRTVMQRVAKAIKKKFKSKRNVDSAAAPRDETQPVHLTYKYESPKSVLGASHVTMPATNGRSSANLPSVVLPNGGKVVLC
mmetsp:Transcript_21992/g.65922  ORF Transcript_21992/g.65922 Transcript_21992/m.65922 type:complete len:666 (-) Transcript_21992:1652-3649(-)